MKQIPITYYYEFDRIDDKVRPHILYEFAANGAEHIVLSSVLLAQIMQRPALEYQLVRELAAAGLTFCDSHAPFGMYLDLNCPIESARKNMLLRLKLALQTAAGLGVKTMTVHPGIDQHYPEVPLEVQYEYVRRSLDEILPFVGELGITLALENLWFQLSTVDRLLELKKLYPVDLLAFCYDSGHANLLDKGRFYPESNAFKAWPDIPVPWEDRALEKMLDQVVSCHLHDNDGITDMHTIPGRGNIDFYHIMNLLKQAPRLQCIQSEVLPIRVNESIRSVCKKFHELSR